MAFTWGQFHRKHHCTHHKNDAGRYQLSGRYQLWGIYWEYFVDTVWLSWLVQNFVVIVWAYFKPEHTKSWSNFEFDRNTVSGTGTWSKWVIKFNRLFSDSKVHVIHRSLVIMTYTLKLSSPLTWRYGVSVSILQKISHVVTKQTALLSILPGLAVTWHCSLNSLRPIDAIWHQRSRSALVQVMAWHHLGAKPLHEPMLIAWAFENW